MTALETILRTFVEGGVEVIIIGGVAASAHGSARFTNDIDFVYRRTPENLARLVDTLAPYEPYLRGAPPGLPFRWDAETIRHGLNFTLTTTLGPVDLLGEVTGGGTYEDLLPASEVLPFFGVQARFVNLDTLIRLKRAAGRPKDFEAIAELEVIREERDAM